MGVFDSDTSKARTSAWRFTSVNASYDYCSTYPAHLVVPAKISDATLNYGKSYRSKHRIPALVYLHWNNLGSITRASQPMVGLKNARSIQDEKLIEAIFNSHSLHHSATLSMTNASYMSHSPSTQIFGATPTNLIIDARPTTNAMANVAKGAGTENMEHYRNCKKVYLGIDNIHVMRDSFARVVEAIRQPDHINHDLLRRSGWLKHLSCILEGILIIVRAVHLANSHVLVHCSDGWDRTSQLSSLSQLCLDPYYRTLQGFAVLVEKDWISFGHHFGARYGHTVPSRVPCVYTADEEDDEVGFLSAMQQRLNFSGSSHGFKETSPVFDQFLDSVHQLQRQFPQHFQFNDAFLLELQRQLYECKYGNFLYNNEKEKTEAEVSEKTRSVWADLLHPNNVGRYSNPAHIEGDNEVLFPDPKDVKWWTTWFKRGEMNLVNVPVLAGIPGNPTTVESTQEDPVLRSMGISQAISATSSKVPSTSVNDAEREGILPPSSSSSNVGPFQAGLESTAVSQASTAVQGAMRSAWSAWKTVKQGYEGAVRDLAEVPDATGSGTHIRPASPLHRTGSENSVKPSTAKAEKSIGRDSPSRITSNAYPQETKPNARLESPVETIRAADASSSLYHKALDETPWNSNDRDGDPLGVQVGP